MSTKKLADVVRKFRFVAEHEGAHEDVRLASDAERELDAIKRHSAAMLDGDTADADVAVCEPAMKRYLAACDFFESISSEAN